MEGLIFDSPWFVQLLLFLAVAVVGLAAGNAVLSILQGRFRRDGTDAPVAAALMSIATVFALFLGFLAADIWDQKQWATDGAAAEHAALQRFATIAGASGLGDTAAVETLDRYVDAVVVQEWGRDRNRAPAASAQAALAQIWRHSLRLSQQRSEVPAARHLLQVVDDIHNEREARLAIGRGHGQLNAWLTVLVLALFSYVALAVAHLDRPKAGRVAMAVFAVATTTVFMFLALHDSPYAGGVRLEPELIALRP